MWKLIGTKKEHWEQFIFVDEDCVVGRKDATLLISNDPSVSRRHAVLFVKHPEENLGFPSKKSSLFLRDEGSKYGTFKNGVRISKEEELSDGSVVKFGQFASEFRIHYEPLIVTSSCLDAPSKIKLKKLIHRLGGHIVSEWQPSCTHLVMNLVKITIKALCCLVSLKPIVLPEYFEELEKMLKSSSSIILPKEFIPPIGESLIDKNEVSFDVNLERKNIFKNKTFFFMDNKQFKKLHLGVITGGGNASILSEDKFNPDLLLHENTCFIEPVKGQLITEQSKSLFMNIKNTLQMKNLRMIPESDIGLAVAYASTEKFCNPSFNIGSAILSSQRIPSQSLTQREVYVPDTQESVKRSKPSVSNFLSSINNEPKPKKQKVENADSLNLTTFREDPEDVFEIPLSAQVKQELDNMFDVTMKDDQDDVQSEEVRPVSPVEQKLEVNVNTAMLNDIKEVPTNQRNSPKQPTPGKSNSLVNGNGFAPLNRNSPKIQPTLGKSTPLVNGNGFAPLNRNDVDDENLPRNLMEVQFVDLVVRKPALFTDKQVTNSGVKNVKKFRKVWPLRSRVLPKIIGVHELIPYDKDAAKFEENWNDQPEVINTRPVKGEFDWGSQN